MDSNERCDMDESSFGDANGIRAIEHYRNQRFSLLIKDRHADDSETEFSSDTSSCCWRTGIGVCSRNALPSRGHETWRWMTGAYGPPRVNAEGTRDFVISGVCGIPAGAQEAYRSTGACGNGEINVYASDDTDVITDMAGVFVTPTVGAFPAGAVPIVGHEELGVIPQNGTVQVDSLATLRSESLGQPIDGECDGGASGIPRSSAGIDFDR